MVQIEVKYDNGVLRKELDRLLRSGRDPATREIAGRLADRVAESVECQASPDGPWERLKDKTVKERRRKGYGGPILQRGSDLSLRILSDRDRGGGDAGSNKALRFVRVRGDLTRGSAATIVGRSSNRREKEHERRSGRSGAVEGSRQTVREAQSPGTFQCLYCDVR